MPWTYLAQAGLLKVVWATPLKASEGFSHAGYAVPTALAAAASFLLFGLAMKDLPLGTAHSVWVGIGGASAP
ncbi:MAG: SMR family transporter [Pseudomonadota bacterium]